MIGIGSAADQPSIRTYRRPVRSDIRPATKLKTLLTTPKATTKEVVILVEIPEADGIRIVGNLLGDPLQELIIGSEVTGVFEHHLDETPPFTLLQWQLA